MMQTTQPHQNPNLILYERKMGCGGGAINIIAGPSTLLGETQRLPIRLGIDKRNCPRTYLFQTHALLSASHGFSSGEHRGRVAADAWRGYAIRRGATRRRLRFGMERVELRD